MQSRNIIARVFAVTSLIALLAATPFAQTPDPAASKQKAPQGKSPKDSNAWVGNIEEATNQNDDFRRALFTGGHIQLTVMSIAPGSEIGLEVHKNLDQFIRVESGQGKLILGPEKDKVEEKQELKNDWAVIIPAGTWHNIVNTGKEPLKLYSLYAPPQHPAGTVHRTEAEARAAEKEKGH